MAGDPSAPSVFVPPTHGYTAGEMGFPVGEPSQPGTQPPGGGGYAVPQFLQFSSLVSSASRAHRFTFDEAMRDSRENARAMWRDAVIWKAVRARQMPTAALSWHIEPRDETSPVEQEARQIVTRIVERLPNFQRFRMHLLDAVFFGRAAVQMRPQWEYMSGERRLVVAGYEPVHPDSLRFKRDGTPGVVVHSTFPGQTEPTDWGMCHFIGPDERDQFVIHKHEPEAADFLEGERSGAVHGVGLRGRLYWLWWMKQQVLALLMNYLERFANGLTIFYYDAHNPKAKAEAEAAASQQFSNVALIYPRWSDSRDTNGVQRLEAGSASPALLQHLVTEYFDTIIEQAIVGQTLSSDTAATGLGSGVADLHGKTLARIIKYDAVNLDATVQSDLIDMLYRWNCPGVPPGKFSSEVDSPNSEEVMRYAQQLFEMGVALDEDQLFKISQMQKPKPGAGIVSKLRAMQPAAVGGVGPEGVPVAGGPGMAQPGDPQQAPGPPGEPATPPPVATTGPIQTVRGGGLGAAMAASRKAAGATPSARALPVRAVEAVAVA